MPILAISGYSTAGKTYLAQVLPELQFSQLVSVTTRPIRPGELAGLDYHYVSEKEFQSFIDKGELLEWNEYCGFKYGLQYETVERAMQANLIPCHVCTPSGVEALKEYADNNSQDLISIFIESDPATIIHRMIKRWQSMPKICLLYLADRLATSLQIETSWTGLYNYIAPSSDHIISEAEKLIASATGENLIPVASLRKTITLFPDYDSLRSCIHNFLENSNRPRNFEESRSVTSDLIIRLFHSS